MKVIDYYIEESDKLTVEDGSGCLSKFHTDVYDSQSDMIVLTANATHTGAVEMEEK